MAGTIQVRLDQAQDFLSERPGTALLLASGGALLLGFWGGQYYAHRVADGKRAALRKQLLDNIESGYSTPQTSRGTPRTSTTGDTTFTGEDSTDYRLVLICNASLRMGKAKTAVQVSRASLGQFKKLWKQRNEDQKIWERSGSKQVCLEVDGEEGLMKLEQAAKGAGLPTHTVKDLQSDGARVRSIMAVGPADFQRLHAVTQHLRLMQASLNRFNSRNYGGMN